ncbi:hypothetical protein [Schlesneria paludicola]|uniref:hypothetical protein n=1 Tax=Schlesneria paludicola TaxID=360056 RepID=UPI00029A1E13|nr:hypothetical protein [Schlesneria paludicola]
MMDTSDSDRLNLLERLVFEREALKELPVPPEILEVDEVRMALGKDALCIGQIQSDGFTRDSIARLLNELRLTPEQIRVMTDWVSLENKILRHLGAGQEWRRTGMAQDRNGAGQEWMAPENDAKEILSCAAAVGVPLGTLYAAGITGFSAVGITSGLAAIGGYTGLGILGLNPMTAGIAGLIIAGVTVKKVADFALGNAIAGAKAIQAQIEQHRNVQLKAANRLAGDIPRFPLLGGMWGIFRRGRRKKLVEVMRNSLLMLENGVQEAKGPKRDD